MQLRLFYGHVSFTATIEHDCFELGYASWSGWFT